MSDWPVDKGSVVKWAEHWIQTYSRGLIGRRFMVNDPEPSSVQLTDDEEGFTLFKVLRIECTVAGEKVALESQPFGRRIYYPGGKMGRLYLCPMSTYDRKDFIRRFGGKDDQLVICTRCNTVVPFVEGARFI